MPPVTFSKKSTLILSLHLNDYTEEEKIAAYYVQEDFRFFKQDVKRTLHEHKNSMTVSIYKSSSKSTVAGDDDCLCLRGADDYSKEASKKRRKARREAMKAVFNEQEAQWGRQEDEIEEKGFFHWSNISYTLDHEQIAAVYAPLTKENAIHAHFVGLADADEVISCQNKNRKSVAVAAARLRNENKTNILQCVQEKQRNSMTHKSESTSRRRRIRIVPWRLRDKQY